MIGEVVNNYRIVSVLAKGGMGIVYVAEHVTIGQKAVIKQLLPELSQNAEVVARFFNEARAAAAIGDPGIVRIYDQGVLDDGTAYITMELLEGESLAARLRRERTLAPPVAVAILRQAARAVGVAHRAGIIHRDLKPDNLSLCPDPELPLGIRVKVLDFGIAKLRDEAGAVKTRTEMAMGTPGYMSPEQWRSAATVDERTDVYALGCIFYEMLAGALPFPGPSLPEFIDQHRYAPPPRVGASRPTLAVFDDVVRRALAKDPKDRPATMDELIRALPDGAALSGHAPRRWWLYAAPAALVVAAGAAVVWPKPQRSALDAGHVADADAAPPRRVAEPVVTVGACRFATEPLPIRRRPGPGPMPSPAGAGAADDGELKPWPVDVVAGEYKRKVVPGHLRQHVAEIASCYRQALSGAPGLAGTTTLSLKLFDDGTVETARAAGLGHDATEACVAGVARGIKMARPPGGRPDLRCPIAFALRGELGADVPAFRWTKDGEASSSGAPSDRLVVEVDDDATAASAVEALAAARRRFSGLARRQGRSWFALGVLLEGEALPTTGAEALSTLRAVSVLVEPTEIRVATVAGQPSPPVRFPAGDVRALRDFLASVHGHDDFADISWLELAAGAGVRYRDLVPVVEAALQAGFPEVDLRPRDELSAEL